MLQILGLILPLFGLIVIGFVAARITRQPVEALGWLNTFIVYVALPALFIKLLSRTPVEQLANFGFIGADVVATYAIFLLTFVLGVIGTRGNVGEATMQGLAGAYGNIGYMGAAVAILALGERAAVPVALIICFENTMHFIMAPALMALHGEQRQSPAQLVLDVLRKIFTHPFIVATIVGIALAFADVELPEAITRLIDYLAQAAAPCALFAMGVTLALRPLKRVPLALGYIVPIKLIVHPIVMYFTLSWMGDFDPVWVYTAVLLASLPTATNVFVIAQQYGVWVERSSATVMITTALSVLTVSAWLYLVTTGALPPDWWPQSR
jgi:malonate transporter